MDTTTTRTQTSTEEWNPFARNPKVPRSPTAAELSSRGEKTPATQHSATTENKAGATTTKLEHAIELVDELSDFITPRHNVHGDIKKLVAKIQRALIAAKAEKGASEDAAQQQAQSAEKWKRLAMEKVGTTDLDTSADRREEERHRARRKRIRHARGFGVP